MDQANADTEFLGRPYNFADWRPTSEERRYFQYHAPRAGEQAPDFTLPTLDGGEVGLSALRGMPAVIEFGSVT